MKCSRILGTCADSILFNQVSYLQRILENIPLLQRTQEFLAGKLLKNFSPVNLFLVHSDRDEDKAFKWLLQPLILSHTSLRHTYRK